MWNVCDVILKYLLLKYVNTIALYEDIQTILLGLRCIVSTLQLYSCNFFFLSGNITTLLTLYYYFILFF